MITKIKQAVKQFYDHLNTLRNDPNNPYYVSPRFTVGSHTYHTYMCIGMRDRGKTTLWIALLYARYLLDFCEYLENTSHKISHCLIFVRRTEEQLKLTCNSGKDGIFTSVFSAYPELAIEGIEISFYKNKIQLTIGENKFYCGYYYDLNKVKGIAIDDADTLLFDEIVELNRATYKGGQNGINEPDILARLDETLFRHRENWHIYLGNDDMATDPYRENFKVPYGAKFFTNKEREFMYEFDVNSAMQEKRAQTVCGKRWQGTKYNEYAQGNRTYESIDEDFICEKPKHCEVMYNIKVAGQKLTIWRDTNTGINYVHDDCNFDPRRQIYSITEKDMSVNANFMSFNSEFLKWVKFMYGGGYFRYNNQRAYSLFMLVVGLS